MIMEGPPYAFSDPTSPQQTFAQLRVLSAARQWSFSGELTNGCVH
jgi:hypothetical protein